MFTFCLHYISIMDSLWLCSKLVSFWDPSRWGISYLGQCCSQCQEKREHGGPYYCYQSFGLGMTYVPFIHIVSAKVTCPSLMSSGWGCVLLPQGEETNTREHHDLAQYSFLLSASFSPPDSNAMCPNPRHLTVLGSHSL